MAKRLLKLIVSFIYEYLLLPIISCVNKYKPTESIIIISSGRSGSSWLSEMISSLNKSVVIYEPLHLGKIRALLKIGFEWVQYLPRNSDWTEAKYILTSLFNNTFLKDSFLFGSNYLKILTADYYVHKTLNAHFLIDYLLHNSTYKLILLIRNPFSVVSSQLKFDNWQPLDTSLYSSSNKYIDFYTDYRQKYESLPSKVEKLAATWAFKNQFIYQFKDHPNCKLIFYENLVSDTENELKKIQEFLKLDQSKFNKLDLNQNSKSSFSPNISITKDTRLENYLEGLTKEEINSISNVLKIFKFNIYDSTSPFPIVSF